MYDAEHKNRPRRPLEMLESLASALSRLTQLQTVGPPHPNPGTLDVQHLAPVKLRLKLPPSSPAHHTSSHDRRDPIYRLPGRNRSQCKPPIFQPSSWATVTDLRHTEQPPPHLHLPLARSGDKHIRPDSYTSPVFAPLVFYHRCLRSTRKEQRCFGCRPLG